MSVIMVRQKVKEGSVEAAEAAARDLFATLARVRPAGIRYASTRVVNSSTFVILAELADGSEDPRRAIPEFGRFLELLQGWEASRRHKVSSVMNRSFGGLDLAERQRNQHRVVFVAAPFGAYGCGRAVAHGTRSLSVDAAKPYPRP
jgi:hypothetical protein